MKRIVSLVLVLVLCLSISVFADDGFDESKIYVTYNNIAINFDVDPVVIEGRTLTPIRAIANKIGITDENISYNEATQEVVIKYLDKTIKMKINSKDAYINDELKELDVPATEINGRTLIPLRFVSESFDKDVEWLGFGNNANGGFVVITDKK